tara:strand:+ start:1382 stop:2992 length:1611 start_codon:yes stop_codon:yes gene_type:complete
VNKVKTIFNDVVFVSRLTAVNKKKIRILFSAFLANLTVLFDILVILSFASLIDNSNTEPSVYVSYILNNLYLLPLIVFLRFLFIFIERINIQSLQLQVEENLRTYLMKEVFSKSNYSVADAYFYVNELSRNVSYFYGSLASSLNYALQIGVFSTYLLLTNLSSVSYFFIGAVVLFFPTKYFLSRGRKYIHEAYINEHKTLENIQKVLENIYLIKILKTTNRELDDFQNTLRKYYSAVLNNFKFGAVNNITPNFVTIFILAVLISFFNFAKILTLEFIGIMLRLFQTLGNLNTTLNLVVNSHVHLEKLNLLERNKIKERSEVHFINEDTNSDFAVNLESVSFKYFGSENNIFENLQLSLKKNNHTLITGVNGSGKSTLLGIISGILTPDQGTVTVVSNKFAYVGATPLIIKGTLRENLMYGNNLDIKDDEILEFVKSYKLYNEEIEDVLSKEVTNKNLSSGQMQKVSFIRAMLSKPDVLILDESTSNLDYDSKRIINGQLKESKLTIVNSTHNIQEIDYDMHYEIEIKDDKRSLREV